MKSKPERDLEKFRRAEVDIHKCLQWITRNQPEDAPLLEAKRALERLGRRENQIDQIYIQPANCEVKDQKGQVLSVQKGVFVEHASFSSLIKMRDFFKTFWKINQICTEHGYTAVSKGRGFWDFQCQDPRHKALTQQARATLAKEPQRFATQFDALKWLCELAIAKGYVKDPKLPRNLDF